MKRRAVYFDYARIILGAFIMGFAIKNIYTPVGLVTGGVSGIAIIGKSQLEIPLWVTNTVLNIPLFLISIKLKGWSFIKRTFVATILLSLSLLIIPELPFLMEDLFLTSLFGGIISGVGMGLVLMSRATTGGTDMLAALLQRTMKHYSIAQIMQVLDACIVLIGASIFGITYALYALIAIFAVSKISDGMIEGVKFSKAVYIVSEQHEKLADMIMDTLDRGVTGMSVRGMYSKTERNMLFCVVGKKEIVQLKEMVHDLDPSAFIIVSDVREVLGEGFIEYRQ